MIPWDEAKNEINQQRHKLSFGTALLVFEDAFVLTVEDYIDDNGEMRFQTVGLAQGVLIAVGHVYRVIDGSRLHGSSRQERRLSMSKKSTGHTEDKIKREIEALKKMPESEIDTSDLPVLPPEKWAKAVVGKFYRPIKEPIALRIDADILAWLKSEGAGYQSRINEILRREMNSKR